MSFWSDPVGSTVGFVTDTASSVGGAIGDVWEDIFNPSAPTISSKDIDASQMQGQIMKETGLQQQQALSNYNVQAQGGNGTGALSGLGSNFMDASNSGSQLYYKTGLDTYMKNETMANTASQANKGAEAATNALTKQFLGGALGGVASLAGSLIKGGGGGFGDTPEFSDNGMGGTSFLSQQPSNKLSLY